MHVAWDGPAITACQRWPGAPRIMAADDSSDRREDSVAPCASQAREPHLRYSMTTRRQFIRTSVVVGGAALAGCGRAVAGTMNGAVNAASNAAAQPSSPTKLKL